MRKFFIYGLCLLFLGSCRSIYERGNDYFKEAKYEIAIAHYKRITNILTAHNVDLMQANYMLGESYRLSNRLTQSMPHYKISYELGYTGKEKNLPYYYALSLKANGQYDEAAKYFKEYYEAGGDEGYVKVAKKEYENAQKIIALTKEESFTKISNCSGINTPDAEFSPAILQKKIVFSSSRQKERIFETNGLGFNDLYVFNFTDSANCQGALVPFFTQNVNTYYAHEASPTFSSDGRTMIFARSNREVKGEKLKEVKLFKSTFNGTQWTEATILEPISVDTTETWDACPALSPDGKTLYFASRRTEDSYGGIDLFKATKDANGGWTNIQNLGKPFNTEGDDMFPYVASDGRFFFASDGHLGLGNLDLFVIDTVTTKTEGGATTNELKIRNLGVPMNSNADDFGIVFSNKYDGYFSTNRKTDGAKGDDDIFAFKNDSVFQKKVTYCLQGIAYQRDEVGKETILAGATIQLKDSSGTVVDQVVADDNGKFKFPKPIAIDRNFVVFGEKGVTYLTHDTTFSTVGRGVKDITKLPKRENEICFDTRVSLRQNIFKTTDEKTGIVKDVIPEITILYDYNKSNIRQDAAATLDGFYDFLKEYFEKFPDQVLEMGSHTDSRGKDAYNQKLSQSRAESAVAYLVKKGVPSTRIRAKGYGETEPKIKAAKTEEEHQQNRRTTVKIVKK